MSGINWDEIINEALGKPKDYVESNFYSWKDICPPQLQIIINDAAYEALQELDDRLPITFEKLPPVESELESVTWLLARIRVSLKKSIFSDKQVENIRREIAMASKYLLENIDTFNERMSTDFCNCSDSNGGQCEYHINRAKRQIDIDAWKANHFHLEEMQKQK